jgi:hypothetical protein
MEQFTKSELYIIANVLRASSIGGSAASSIADKAQRMMHTAPGANTSEVTESKQERTQRKINEFGIRYGATGEQLEQYALTPAQRVNASEMAEQEESDPLVLRISEEQAAKLAASIGRILDEELGKPVGVSSSEQVLRDALFNKLGMTKQESQPKP